MIRFDLVKIVSLFILSSLCQLFLIPMISIYNVYPNLIVLVIIFFTLKNGQIYGTVLGFLFGFTFDFISGGVLGSAMFSFTLVGFVSGYFYDETRQPSEIKPLLLFSIVFICSFVSAFFYSALGTNLLNEIFNSMILFSLSCGIYSTLIAVPIILLKLPKLVE